MRDQRQLLDSLLEGMAPERLIAWFYTPMAMAFAAHLTPDVTVYDCMDELSAFRGAPPELIRFERQLMQRADLVFTGGQSLYESKQKQHAHAHCFPSSIDAAHFAPARGALEEPADMARLPRPRLGYFGVVDERMDIVLLDEMAALRPDWSFVMIGPVVKIDPASLPRRPNIHWLGQKSYAELPRYLAHWDIGLMNFALNESTRFISPTKTPEYLAAGLPVISTPIVDVVRGYGERGFVEIVNDAEDAVRAAAMLLSRPRQPWLSQVDRHLASMSWDRTWGAMRDLIAARLDDGAAPRTTTTAGVRADA
ncbi:MAG: glycosyltransferase [Acetobacteraceae bacterium]|nr:glycosyltransferase [Acetobacteraceae bacterium]